MVANRALILRPLSVLGMASLLSACGGGGGGDPLGIVDNKVGIALVSPAISCDLEPGAACVRTVAARPLSVDGNFTWMETPANGVDKAILDINRIKQPDGTWLMEIKAKPGLLPGVYSGSVRLDLITVGVFSNVLPSTLNYRFSVAPLAGTLSNLARNTGIGDWEGFNGNAAHTGYVGLTLDPARFKRRFTRVSDDNSRFYAMAAANGHLLLTQSTDSPVPNAPFSASLQSIRESDNALEWRVQSARGFTNLAASGTRVVATNTENEGRVLGWYDASSGNRVFARTDLFNRVLDVANLYAPVMLDQAVLAGNGTDGQLQSLSDGSLRWNVSLRDTLDPHFSNWSPAAFNGQVMINQRGQFSVYAANTGALQFQVAVPGPGGGSIQTVYELNQAPVMVDANSVALLDQRNSDGSPRDNTMSLVDLAKRQIRWQATGQFTAHPVSSQGMVYAGNHKTMQLEARDAVSGNVVWNWPLQDQQESGFAGDLIVTNNLIFVAAKNQTYAIDLTTHKVVWSYPLSGNLALSNQGVLYILNQGSDLALRRSWVAAINVQ